MGLGSNVVAFRGVISLFTLRLLGRERLAWAEQRKRSFRETFLAKRARKPLESSASLACSVMEKCFDSNPDLEMSGVAFIPLLPDGASFTE